MPDFPNPVSEPQATPVADGKSARRKERVGEVVSNKMAKTIVVRVQRRFPHPQFKKVVTAYSKLYAHDEKGEARLGDQVKVVETRPLSRTKRWRLVSVLSRKHEAVTLNA